MYVEDTPVSPVLQPLIECFWLSQSTSVLPTPHRVVPDGCTDMIYVLPGLAGFTDQRSLDPRVVPTLVGTMTQPIVTQLEPTHDYVGIRFKPGGMAAFIQAPLFTLTDTIRPIDSLCPALGSSIRQPLGEAGTWSQRVDLLEGYLLTAFRQPADSFAMVAPLVQHLLSTYGNVPITRLSQMAKRTPRQVERLFLRYVGVSPKLLARIVRFRRIKSVLDKGTADSLMGLAFDHGYTDHAHLTKDFKSFAGLVPSVYAGK